MKKILTILVVFICLQLNYAQISMSAGESEGKWRVGGGVGLNFGSDSYVSYNIAPSVGYMLTNKLETGITVGYYHAKNDFFKSSLFVGGPFTNYHILNQFFARAKFEHLTGKQKFEEFSMERNISENALWLGGGYTLPGRISFQIGLMYNVLYDEDKSVFNTPFRPYGGIVYAL